MTYKWTKLANQNPTEFKYVSLIGVGGKWNEGDDIDLKQVAPHNWYLAKQEIPAGGLKIRADHKWRDDGNWGFAEGQNYENKGTLITSGGSSNISVPAGTYNIYFNDITGAYAFVEVKQHFVQIVHTYMLCVFIITRRFSNISRAAYFSLSSSLYFSQKPGALA